MLCQQYYCVEAVVLCHLLCSYSWSRLESLTSEDSGRIMFIFCFSWHPAGTTTPKVLRHMQRMKSHLSKNPWVMIVWTVFLPQTQTEMIIALEQPRTLIYSVWLHLVIFLQTVTKNAVFLIIFFKDWYTKPWYVAQIAHWSNIWYIQTYLSEINALLHNLLIPILYQFIYSAELIWISFVVYLCRIFKSSIASGHEKNAFMSNKLILLLGKGSQILIRHPW